MKLMEKLKNALFEEEYVDVEEKPKKEKKKEKKYKREKRKEKDIEQIKKKGREQAREDIEEEKPIVKKIATPKEEEQEEIDHLEQLDDFEEDRNELKGNNDFKFQEILDDDFSYEEEKPKIEPQFYSRKPVLEEKKPEPKKEEKPLYSGGKKEETFGFEKNYNTSHTYDSRPTKSSFKPSPIISPIYGVLDKNYQKDEIVSKREVRMPSFENEHLDIDEVRNRAYGIKPDTNMLFDVEEENMHDIEEDIENEDNNDLLDLTDQNETPSVSKVTVGDAEEYFEDLGLEYNNDYIDVSKEKATGRRVVENKETREKIEEENTKIEENKPEEKSEDENLFDLIDSMYEKE